MNYKIKIAAEQTDISALKEENLPIYPLNFHTPHRKFDFDFLFLEIRLTIHCVLPYLTLFTLDIAWYIYNFGLAE